MAFQYGYMASAIQNASVTIGSLRCKGPKPCPIGYFPSPTCENRVRLGGSFSSGSGHIDISYKGQWRSLCKDNFRKEDGDVICRMAGYPKGAYKIYEDSSPGNNFWKSDFQCLGVEKDISECQFNQFIRDRSCSQKGDFPQYIEYSNYYRRAAVECKF